MCWTNWVRLKKLSENPAEHCGPGVYQIRATLKNRQPITIHRACGADREGILYIGQGNLCDRIGYLMNICYENPKPNHHFTSTFVKNGLDRIADRDFLEVRWRQCDSPPAEESRLIKDYLRHFGDLPPGNLTTGG